MTDQLVEWIKKAREKGQDEVKIHSQLKSLGWKEKQIEAACERIYAKEKYVDWSLILLGIFGIVFNISIFNYIEEGIPLYYGIVFLVTEFLVFMFFLNIFRVKVSKLKVATICVGAPLMITSFIDLWARVIPVAGFLGMIIYVVLAVVLCKKLTELSLKKTITLVTLAFIIGLVAFYALVTVDLLYGEGFEQVTKMQFEDSVSDLTYHNYTDAGFSIKYFVPLNKSYEECDVGCDYSISYENLEEFDIDLDMSLAILYTERESQYKYLKFQDFFEQMKDVFEYDPNFGEVKLIDSKVFDHEGYRAFELKGKYIILEGAKIEHIVRFFGFIKNNQEYGIEIIYPNIEEAEIVADHIIDSFKIYDVHNEINNLEEVASEEFKFSITVPENPETNRTKFYSNYGESDTYIVIGRDSVGNEYALTAEIYNVKPTTMQIVFPNRLNDLLGYYEGEVIYSDDIQYQGRPGKEVIVRDGEIGIHTKAFTKGVFMYTLIYYGAYKDINNSEVSDFFNSFNMQ